MLRRTLVPLVPVGILLLGALGASVSPPALAAAAPAGPATPASPAAVAGTWHFTITTPNQAFTPTVIIRQDGNQLGGRYAGTGDMKADLKEVSVQGNYLKFSVDLPVNGQTMHLDFGGTVNGDAIKGDVKTPYGPMPFTAERAMALSTSTPPAAPAGAAGDWALTIQAPDHTYTPTLSLRQEGDHYSGQLTGDDGHVSPLTGVAVTGDSVKFAVDFGSPDSADKTHVAFTGTVNGDTMIGQAAAPMGSAPFMGKRKTALIAKPSFAGKPLSGDWVLTLTTPRGEFHPHVTLTQDGEKLTGAFHSPDGDTPIQDGSVKDGAIDFVIVRSFNGQDHRMEYTGKLNGDHLSGQVKSDRGTLTWTGDRQAK